MCFVVWFWLSLLGQRALENSPPVLTLVVYAEWCGSEQQPAGNAADSQDFQCASDTLARPLIVTPTKGSFSTEGGFLHSPE